MNHEFGYIFVIYPKKCVQTCEKIEGCMKARIILDSLFEFKEFLRNEYNYDGEVIEIDINDTDSLIQHNIPLVYDQYDTLKFHESFAYGVIKCYDGLVIVFQILQPSKQKKELLDQLFERYFRKES